MKENNNTPEISNPPQGVVAEGKTIAIIAYITINRIDHRIYYEP